MDQQMFCYQCEQTACGRGCTSVGVCGKKPECSAAQDLLLALTKKYAANPAANAQFIADALFTTVTNVNFDTDNILKMCQLIAKEISEKIPEDKNELLEYAKTFQRNSNDGQELTELIIYGLKGLAAYRHHAARLGLIDANVDNFVRSALHKLNQQQSSLEELLTLAMETGKQNYRIMELLNEGHIARFGVPTPTQVRITPVAGKAILISGHDLDDLEALLKLTQNKGINIYTHGEMLPAHSYPELKKYPHLIGNYGGAWQDQQREFENFPGAILMTTNCIQKPRESYSERIFTTGLVEYPGVKHLKNGDFATLLDSALAAKGFTPEDAKDEKYITVGFGHHAVGSVAPAVIEAIKAGKIRHFFLVGGCDGIKPGRNYYTQLAEQIPNDCIILTLACGKYRFNKLEFGTINGIPRLLDVGQCNDAYSAIRIALMLAEAFNCGVNDLPLTIILSWYEQKAVAVLLTLLALGVKNIKLGPSLPAFVSPEMLNILSSQFGIAPISTPEADITQALS